MNVSDSDLKNRGLAAIEDAISLDSTCLLTQKGKPVYAVIDLDNYYEFRMWQLDKVNQDD